MKIAQHNGNLWKVAGGRKICQALFLLCGLIKAVIMSGVQNNMRTREVRTFSDRVVLLLKYNQYLFHKTGYNTQESVRGVSNKASINLR